MAGGGNNTFIINQKLLEVQLPYDPVGSSVGRSVGRFAVIISWKGGMLHFQKHLYLK